MTEKTKIVRTRFAPSPTGYLHIGGLRTALFAYLLARKNSGQFILRIEDTDQARFVEGAIEKLVSIIRGMGLEYDEGVFAEDGKIISKGDRGPYLQSERKTIYKEYVDQLIESKGAYYCFCSQERLDEVRKEQQALKKPTLYDRRCRNLSHEEIKKNLSDGMPFVVRQAIPLDGTTSFHDQVYGDITWENKLLDDQVLLKSDGFPTYHLAVVVDDHLMQISHVIRGEEWIPSTPKHILLYKQFQWEMPEFAHLPLLLNKDRSKLSKRQGDVSVEDYLAKGYLKEALINFVALLGWNPKTTQEIFTIDELIEQFDLAKVNKSGAVLDVDKLDWLNNLYIRKLSEDKLIEYTLPFLISAGLVVDDGATLHNKSGKIITKDFVAAIMNIEKERLKNFTEIGERVKYFFEQPDYNPELLIWRKSNLAATRENLSNLSRFLEGLDDKDFNKENLEARIKEFIASNNLDNGSVLWPLRVAMSGMEASPGPFEIVSALYIGYGKFEILQRIEEALKRLQ